jgi:peptidoglycan/xylan/chitin deacetylase (PgdA/CDA1 family)
MPEHVMAQSWRELYRTGPRSTIRNAAISALAQAWAITGRTASLLRHPRVHVLLLHHVFPDEEQGFRKLLKSLAVTHTFISYSEAMRRAKAGGTLIKRPYISITFDDGFKNCLRAASIMEECGARGCFFVCPGIVDETDPANIERFCRERLELLRPVEFMNWDDLIGLKIRGHEIGGHTMSHVNLARVPLDEARREIAECHEVIARKLGECRHFAWTYGRFTDFPSSLQPEVFESGFESCASGERGCHGPKRPHPDEPLIIRREHIIAGEPAQHAMYFLARSARNTVGA